MLLQEYFRNIIQTKSPVVAKLATFGGLYAFLNNFPLGDPLLPVLDLLLPPPLPRSYTLVRNYWYQFWVAKVDFQAHLISGLF